MTEEELDSRLDRMLRGKLRHSEFEMKASYWIDARKMMQEEEGKKKRGWIFLFSMITLAGLGGILMTFLVTGQVHKTAPGSHTSELPKKSNVMSLEKNPAQAIGGILPVAARPQPAKTMQTDAKKTRAIGKKDPAQTFKNETKAYTADAPLNSAPSFSEAPASETHLLSFTPEPNRQQSKPKEEEQVVHHHQEPLFFAPPAIALLALEPFRVSSPCDSCAYPFVWTKPDTLIEPEEKDMNFLTAEAGITYFNASGADKNTEFTGGFRYHYLLRPGLYLNSGFYYTRLHQHLPTLHYQSIRYGFGKTVDRTDIKTARLDYIQLPVHLSKRIFRNNYLVAGFSYGYLVYASNRVSTQRNEQAAIMKKDQGYTYAVNRHDVQLNIGYTMMFPQKLVLSFMYGYGLMDITRNKDFHSKAIDRNIGFRISAGYKITTR